MDDPPTDPRETTCSSPQDVRNAYLLFLARPAEAGVEGHFAGHSPAAIGRAALASPEFNARIGQPLAAGEFVAVAAEAEAAFPDLAAWAADALPLARAARARARAARNWHALAGVTLADAAFRRAMAPAAAADMLETLAGALAARARDLFRLDLFGAIEVCDAHGVSGWAINRAAPEEVLTLEAWADGAFLGAATASHPRPDVRAQHGGAGDCGFAIAYELAPGAEPAEIVVREAIKGQRLGAARVERDPQARLETLADISRQLGEIRQTLARIERLVPPARLAASFSLAAWDRYWQTFYRPPPGAPPPVGEMAEPLFTLVMVAEGEVGGEGEGEVGAVQRRLAAIGAQTFAAWELIAGARESAASEDLRDAFAQAAARTTRPMRLTHFPDDTAVATMRNLLADAARGRFLIFADAGLLAPDALAVLARAAEGGEAALIYADGDTLAADGTHLAPQLRGDFDGELIAQTAPFGDLTAIAAEAFAAAGGFSAAYEAVQDHDLWLRIVETAGAQAIVHIPRVLHHRLEVQGRADPAEASAQTLACVAEHLARTGRTARVEPHRDILAGPRPSAVRLAPEGLAGVTARLIIPTRDRFDLVEKCLASLERHRDANAARFEVVIVDNASDPATAPATLELLAGQFAFTVMSYDGPFNWAAINNAAAREAAADVLVFLNNDTVAIAPAWLDALAGQAMRPDVGAVGARLIYEDGRIQHGGMVVGGDGLPAHEGVGQAGADGGYLGRQVLAREVIAVTGACLATPREVFERLGGFDALTFPVTCNDADYCCRVRQAGLKVIYEPAATLYHLESRTRGVGDAARADREAAAFKTRWADFLTRDPHYNPHFEPQAPPFTRLGPPPEV